MNRCPRCGFKELEAEAARSKVDTILRGVPDLHRKSYQKFFRSIRLMSNVDTTCDELGFMEKMAFEHIPSLTVLEVVSALMNDPGKWDHIKNDIEHKLPYIAAIVSSACKRTRKEHMRIG